MWWVLIDLPLWTLTRSAFLKVRRMKGLITAVVVLVLTGSGFCQQKVQIRLCEELKEFKDDARFSVVQDHDTLTFPQLGDTKYVNPLNLKGTGGEYDKADTSAVMLIIENYKYSVTFPIDRKDLFCGYLGICREPAKFNKKLTVWNYTNCKSFRSIEYAELVRKKR